LRPATHLDAAHAAVFAARTRSSSIAPVLRRRRDMNQLLEGDRLRQLIAVGPVLVSELDLDVLLNRLLETACSVTAAKYAAIGVLDKGRHELERFMTRGVTDEQERAIGQFSPGSRRPRAGD
jgi:hypothetical protein